jgi:hypothetical protein
MLEYRPFPGTVSTALAYRQKSAPDAVFRARVVLFALIPLIISDQNFRCKSP